MHESKLHLCAIVDVCVLVFVDAVTLCCTALYLGHTCRRVLCSLAAFVVVSLCNHNRLSGSVSGSWANMSSLEFFDLGISHFVLYLLPLCLDCDSGINKLSGSFSTSFSARSQLIFFAINGNLGIVRPLFHDLSNANCFPNTGLGPVGVRPVRHHCFCADAGASVDHSLAKTCCFVHRTVEFVVLYPQRFLKPLTSAFCSWSLVPHRLTSP